MRTLVYQNHVEIENVPVLVCTSCERTQVLEQVKPELKSLLKELAKQPERTQVAFNEISSYSRALVDMAVGGKQEAVDYWLDLLLLAQSLKDQRWVEECKAQLRLLSQHSK